MSIAGELSILGTTKSVQRQHLERLYPYIDWDRMPFSCYGDFFALKNILDDCGAVWTNAYGRSNSEDASTRDILPDYSGNGRDIKLYNFGFAGMSGYGGYAQESYSFSVNLSDIYSVQSVGPKVIVNKIDGSSIPAQGKFINKNISAGWNLGAANKIKAGNYGIVIWKTKPRGTEAEILCELAPGDTGTFVNEQTDIDAGLIYIMAGPQIAVPAGQSFSFEFLPTYPGALVSDGVDDYGQCVKDFALPEDYTVVAIRQELGEKSVLAGKSRDSKNGAFLFENNNLTYNYGVSTSVTGSVPALFSYQTKSSYNGVDLNVGDGTDTEEDKFMLFMMRPNADKWSSYALYSLGVFTRTLTDEEMRVVKNCMMAEWAAMTGELDNITYVADWDGKDRSNDEEEPMRSQWVDKKTGRVINLSNFAYAGISGWNGYAEDYRTWENYINRGEYVFTGTKITVKSIQQPIAPSTTMVMTERRNAVAYDIPSYRIRVSGLPSGAKLLYTYQPVSEENTLRVQITSANGVCTVPEIPAGSQFVGFMINAAEIFEEMQLQTPLVIEQLPFYPGALVSDGVDDYGQLAEAIDEEVGTMLLRVDDLGTDINGFFMNSSITDGRLYCWKSTASTINGGLPANSPYDGKYQIISRPPVALGTIFTICKIAVAAIYRLILIREQLDGAQIEFLKWKVDKEHRDWLIRMGLYEEEIPWYGIEFDTTDPSPDVKRIGNMKMHRTLPVQSQMRGCLLNDDGTVAKYLDAADWTSETRDGSAGQVMVEMPKDAYWRFETWGTKRRVKFATTALPGFTRTPQGYDSAYEASVQRSASKLCSVVNTDADYRGGNNSSDRDGTYRSQLGLPATAISRTNFRTYARNRNADSSEWNCMTYDFQKLVYWLFAVEYATLNTQKTFNADRDADGLAQGGLGAGVTTVNYNRWHNFNGVYPFIPCGHTDSLGNGTGQIQFTMPFEYDASPSSSTGLGNNYVGEYLSDTAYTSGQFVSQGEDLYECISDTEAGTPLTDTIHFSKVTRTAVQVPRYRGLENPFGHIWQWTDGINVRISPDSDNGGDGLSKVFVTDNPEYFNDSNYDNMSYIGNEARSDGYIKEIIFGEGGEIMPSVVGGSSTTYFCDYHYTNIPATETLRGVLFGGNANSGANAGFGSAYSYYAPSKTSAHIGSRLCFIPEKA